jgi:hypothetical protein
MMDMPATQLWSVRTGANPAERPQIMGHLVRLYLQALGIGQRPGDEATS